MPSEATSSTCLHNPQANGLYVVKKLDQRNADFDERTKEAERLDTLRSA